MYFALYENAQIGLPAARSCASVRQTERSCISGEGMQFHKEHRDFKNSKYNLMANFIVVLLRQSIAS
jgi:hypothetical protein